MHARQKLGQYFQLMEDMMEDTHNGRRSGIEGHVEGGIRAVSSIVISHNDLTISANPHALFLRAYAWNNEIFSVY